MDFSPIISPSIIYLALKAEKNKGIENLPPEEKTNQKTPEIINTARDVFNDKDSVGAATKSKQPQSIFKRIGNLFTGNK